MSYKPKYSVYQCSKCRAGSPCYCIMETSYTPLGCIDIVFEDPGKWVPLTTTEAAKMFAELNLSDAIWYEPPEDE